MASRTIISEEMSGQVGGHDRCTVHIASILLAFSSMLVRLSCVNSIELLLRIANVSRFKFCSRLLGSCVDSSRQVRSWSGHAAVSAQ